MAASSVLVMCLVSSASAFSTSPVRTTSLAQGIQLVNKAFQFHSPWRLQVAVEPDIGTDDMESLRGDDGIYELVDGEQHK